MPVVDDVASDVARLFTKGYEGGDLITWLGTYRTTAIEPIEPIPTSIDKYIDSLVYGLWRNEKTPALQSEDNAKLVVKALEEKNLAAAFNNKLGGERIVKTFKALLNDENLAETLQNVINNKYLVWILKESLKRNDLLYPKSCLTEGYETLKPSKVDVMNVLQMLVMDNENSQLIKATLEIAVDLKMLGKAFEGARRLNSVEDMLGRTELDTVESLNAIFDDQEKVQLLREAVRYEDHFKKFRLVLDDKKRFSRHKKELADEKWAEKFDALLEDMNLVFFLRVAIKDDGRAKLFRAALERSILEEDKQLHWLKEAVSEDFGGNFKVALDLRDRKLLVEEIVKYLEPLVEDERRRKKLRLNV
ncbi:uncharacterized protein PHALS_13223 [Plasmopara halstedii]|uniref:Uncharacterized protein n=1 Tax=Plasmopara halstedii TaxID=4781 RepID=A0A0P1AP39_PLAHL|nr:uncharacterized protein PHALS_13223 [Plasmopara halstedii]CEG42994.1 hypothetical protein PHALS_13223 [Plasmopara halstedii]|eukprot:XP_024579363.1 hypothetical protein PHALS_13223 [Plasmopara halstedii]